MLKLTVGKVQWCPMVTHIIAHILYWKGVWKRIRGGHISAKYLLRLVKKGVISHSLSNCDLLEEQVLAHICHAYTKYIRIKNNKGSCNHWLAKLIVMQAIENNKLKKSLWKWIWDTERM